MNKSRYWSFILYPESVRENFIEYMQELGVSFAISPLHNKDVNANGEEKKAHYHILLAFDGPTTYNNVVSMYCEPLNATIPKKVLSLRGYFRYLCHLDNPEKAQYDIKDIFTGCDFKVDLTSSEITNLKSLIIRDIEDNCIFEYRDLCNYYLSLGDFDRFDIVSNNTYFFTAYLTSFRISIDKNIKKENS